MGELRTIRRSRPASAQGWLGDFGAALHRASLSAHTRRTYAYDVAQFARWLEQTGGALATLTTSDVNVYRQHLKTTLRRRPSTINHQLQAIRWLCSWSHRHGLMPTNPALEAEGERVPRRRRPAGLSDTEIHRLMRSAAQGRPSQRLRNHALLQLMLQCGLRVGEVVSLVREDLSLAQRSGAVRVREGKGGKEREVPMNASARRTVQAYLATRPDVKPSDPVFVSQRGGRLSTRMVEHLLHTVSRHAKLDALATPHRLRHTFALNYLRQHPGNLVQLANLLGHESIDTTAIYTQPSAEELASQLEASSLNVFGS
jgi:integrase/recombinase XerC